MTDGSFLFARFADRCKLAGVGETLQALDSIKHWDAVDGYFGLAVRFKGHPEADLKKVRSLDGLTESVESRITAEAISGTVDEDLCRVYIMIETDPDRTESVAETVEKYEETLSCARTEGRFGLVAVLQAAGFDQLDRLIDDRISALDGVLRTKEGRIISSFVK